MQHTSKTLTLSNKTLTLETGVLAQQASAAVLARLGDTMVLATVVLGKENPNLDYFPLSVEYMERLYAGGRIKGSRWVKREGRPTDDAILTARLIDRSIRPLFPKDFKREVQVIVTVLSVDNENDPDVLGINAVSAALAISKIPWNGPIGAVRVGCKEDQTLVINPTVSEFGELTLDMVVSGTKDKVLMLEAGAKQIAEQKAFEAIKKAKEENGRIIEVIKELVKAVGEKKEEVVKDEDYVSWVALIEKSYKNEIKELIEAGVNKEVGGSLDALAGRLFELEKTSENTPDLAKIKKAVDYVFKKTIRNLILEESKRPDKRAIDEVRPLDVKVGVLPRTHGSAIFQRGETQVLSVATLATPGMAQAIESPEGEEIKRYMHHYSFPPYSVGETGRVGSPNRREIGHGALAERALDAVIPDQSEFPYAIRVVSETMSSNGSTSQASVCGSTLALMDAGVPLKAPVAGIAMGLMTPLDGKENKYVVLTDIMGLEDFSGDMDFKVAGTKDGITAIQLDVKIAGLTDEMISETLEKAKKARLFILDKMLAVIASPRETVSAFAPKIKTIKIPVEKIGEVIGGGGRTIKNIIATTGATVDVEDDGTVTVSGVGEEAVNRAVEWVGILSRELQKGEVFEGTVKRLMPFGAFVEIVPGKEGLVHVSEMATEYVKDPADVVTIGQKVKVNVLKVDEQGRLNLSMIFGERPQAQQPEHHERRMRPESQPRRSYGSRSSYGGSARRSSSSSTDRYSRRRRA